MFSQNGPYGARHVHCVSKNDTDVAHHNSDADRPILVIFGT